jgi:hypothetical protein
VYCTVEASLNSWLLPSDAAQQQSVRGTGFNSCNRKLLQRAAGAPPPPGAADSTHLPCFFSSAIVPLTLLASVLAAMAATRSAEQRLRGPLLLLLLLLLQGPCGCCWMRWSGCAALPVTQRLLLVMLRGQCATVALHRAERDMWMLLRGAPAYWHSSICFYRLKVPNCPTSNG